MTRVNVNRGNLNAARGRLQNGGIGAYGHYGRAPNQDPGAAQRLAQSHGIGNPGLVPNTHANQPGPAAPGGHAPSAAPAHSTPPAPFLTPDQQQSLDNIINANTQQIINMDQAFGLQSANTTEQAGGGSQDAQGNWHLDNTGTIWTQMLHQRSAANDNEIARGLGVSSIRDGDLNDIETTAALRRESLLNALAITKAANDKTRANLNGATNQARGNANTQAVQNAENLPVTPNQTTYTNADPGFGNLANGVQVTYGPDGVPTGMTGPGTIQNG